MIPKDGCDHNSALAEISTAFSVEQKSVLTVVDPSFTGNRVELIKSTKYMHTIMEGLQVKRAIIRIDLETDDSSIKLVNNDSISNN